MYFLHRHSVIDVYQGWAGPCTGLLNTLRKAKLEIAGDKLQLAVCNANLITKLKRFNNKCEPTMVFLSVRIKESNRLNCHFQSRFKLFAFSLFLVFDVTAWQSR